MKFFKKKQVKVSCEGCGKKLKVPLMYRDLPYCHDCYPLAVRAFIESQSGGKRE